MTLPIRPSMIVGLIGLNLAVGFIYFVKVSQRPFSAQRMTAPVQESGFAGLGLPEFSLVDQNNQPVQRAHFEGGVWVLDFIYTHCPAQCPMLTTKLSALQKKLPASVRFASISVDPANDKPGVLAEYAERYKAESGRWLFLTGASLEIQKILAAMGAPTGVAADAHSLRLYLLDAKGRVAGLYDTSDPHSLEKLAQDTERLIAQPAP